jgi:hypothetical protein
MKRKEPLRLLAETPHRANVGGVQQYTPWVSYERFVLDWFVLDYLRTTGARSRGLQAFKDSWPTATQAT